MRIIMNIDERTPTGRKCDRKVRLRIGYYFNEGDRLRVQNAGVEIYNLLKEGFEKNFSGGIIVFEGEKK